MDRRSRMAQYFGRRRSQHRLRFANRRFAYAIDNGGPNMSTDSGSTWADITPTILRNPNAITRYDFRKLDHRRSQYLRD